MRKHLVLPRRDVLKLGGAGVLGTFIAAATKDIAGAQTPNVETIKANLHKLRMGEFNPNYATAWSYRLAQALGYFKEVGIDDFQVTMSDQYIPGLIGGSLDVSHADTSTALAAGAKSGLGIKLISIYRDKEWWIMGVRKGINTPADLKGKKITGGQLNGRNTWVMEQVLKILGLDPKDMQFVPTSGGSDKRLQALIAGTVDAASLLPRHEAGLKAAGGKFIYHKIHQAPQEGYAAIGSWLEKNEDTAYAYVRADVKARQWLFKPENKEKAYKIMEDYGYSIPPAFKALYQVELNQISPDGGFENAAAMNEFCDVLKKTGDVPKDMDWRKIVDMKYVWAAQKALGLPKRPASLT
ncbi:MAG TPA: ABC transporter substrate-binding protein [Pseudolabrys sp.]|jgi:ABC-type nitrate/sulfonate/bicarbonate transport system substrate-binding protein|nr:ABC transporter substrate-binding protein [Pseudolabrys sp.]